MTKKHGGDIYSYKEKILDFSTNINPLGVHPKVIEAAREALSEVENYPDTECRRLRAALSKKHGVSSENIVCGNGAAEIIFNVSAALKPKKVLLLSPTFSEYEQAIDVIGAEKKYYDLSPENGFLIKEDILNSIDSTVDMVFICNPNNPTGRLIDRDLLIRIADKCTENDAFLVVDECFLDFTSGYEKASLIPYLQKYERNLMVLRAFTKMYAIPGLRLGYGLCGDAVLHEKIREIRQPWSVSVVSEAAGIAACGLENIERETRDFVRGERKRMMESIREISPDKISVFDSDANYILFRAAAVEGKNLDELLLKKSIMIRNCGNYRGLHNDYFRIAVKKKDENDRLIKALEEIYEENNG